MKTTNITKENEIDNDIEFFTNLTNYLKQQILQYQKYEEEIQKDNYMIATSNIKNLLMVMTYKNKLLNQKDTSLNDTFLNSILN